MFLRGKLFGLDVGLVVLWRSGRVGLFLYLVGQRRDLMEMGGGVAFGIEQFQQAISADLMVSAFEFLQERRTLGCDWLFLHGNNYIISIHHIISVITPTTRLYNFLPSTTITKFTENARKSYKAQYLAMIV